MIGKNKDKEFKLEDYEEFYEHHQFVETSDEDAINVHEIIPRFGWGFDMVEKHQPKTLLDLGTLDGSFPITISRHFGIPCAGIDLTKDGINLARERAASPRALRHPRAGPTPDLLVHRMLLQPDPAALDPGLPQPHRLRNESWCSLI